MTAKKLKPILDNHAEWVASEGVRGRRADLSEVDIRGTNLSMANLSMANLHNVNLSRADLSRAILYKADLSKSDLRGANLSGAHLGGANLSGAHLGGANLSDTDLLAADLRGAYLSRTCLDPENKPSGAGSSFKRVRGYVIGYRTRKAGHIDRYRDGRCYSADVFSTDTSECHPGLYLWPTLAQATEWSGTNVEIIKVRTRPTEVHKAGTKWRCRWFEVIGEAKCKR